MLCCITHLFLLLKEIYLTSAAFTHERVQAEKMTHKSLLRCLGHVIIEATNALVHKICRLIHMIATLNKVT